MADLHGLKRRLLGMTMEYFVGIDVSLEFSSVHVVDGSGRILREARAQSEPEGSVKNLGRPACRLWADQPG